MHRNFASSRMKAIVYKSIFPSTHLKGGKKEKSLKKTMPTKVNKLKKQLNDSRGTVIYLEIQARNSRSPRDGLVCVSRHVQEYRAMCGNTEDGLCTWVLPLWGTTRRQNLCMYTFPLIDCTGVVLAMVSHSHEVRQRQIQDLHSLCN